MRSLLVAVVLLAAPAFAYPWMVKHNYGSCSACHVDPSGGGQLTSYGRAQADVLVEWKLTRPPAGKEEEVPASANFLWFAELPESVNLSGNLRVGPMVIPASPRPVVPLLMALDFYATFIAGPVVLHGTGGFATHLDGRPSSASKAVVTPACEPLVATCGSSFVAREYWAGVKLADEAVMLRAGRLNLPFGLRNIEHSSWVRANTLTDINVDQQLGVAVSYNSETLRGEVMGIAGNYQLGPDVYRERGYSAFAEYALRPNAYLGLSSLITHAGADVVTSDPTPTTRHAHGLFVRYAPVPSVALLGEADLLAWSAVPHLDRVGFAAMFQGDFEVMTGLHVIAIAEAANSGTAAGTSGGFWGSLVWYPLPHVELRLDNIARTSGVGTPYAYSFLAQFHVFL